MLTSWSLVQEVAGSNNNFNYNCFFSMNSVHPFGKITGNNEA